MTACFTAATMAIGSKAATFALAIWTIITLLCVVRSRADIAGILAAVLKPSPTFAALLLFAAYAATSALWASDSYEAFKVALVLAAILMIGQMLRRAIERMSPAASVLVAGWFVIGMVCGCLILLMEFHSNFGIVRWVMTTFPNLRPPRNLMIGIEAGHVKVSNAAGNWSVAGVNLLLWPALLIVCSLASGRWRLAIGFLLIAVVAAITFDSEHQTSQLALALSAVIFGLAWVKGPLVRGAAVAACVVLVVGTVPLAQFAFQRIELQNAKWAPFTLQERFKIWGHAAEHVSKAPLIGIGANNATVEHTLGVDPATAGSNRLPALHPHNMILQTWLELGAVGAGILLIVLLTAFGGVSRLNANAVPFAYAMGVMAILQSAATWNLWHDWIQAAFMMAFCVLWLGSRVATDTQSGRAPAFAEIWLPTSSKSSLAA